MYTITRRFEFEAAHRLTKVPAEHKCRRMHGHNYVVTVELRSVDLDAAGMVVDFGALKALEVYIDSHLDHRILNDVLEVETTAELLAWHLYTWCARQWPQTTAVRVEETRGTSAEYRP